MKRIKCSTSGFSLVELLMTVAILSVVIVGLLQLFLHCSILADLAENKTLAVSEAQDKMEEIRNTNYDLIVSTYTTTCLCADGADNDGDGDTDYPDDQECTSYCDDDEANALSAGTDTCRGIFTPTSVTGKGTIYIDAGNPDLLEIEVVVSWQDKDGRIVGEDTNFNGLLDGGEDSDGDGRLDSLAGLVTFIARR